MGEGSPVTGTFTKGETHEKFFVKYFMTNPSVGVRNTRTNIFRSQNRNRCRNHYPSIQNRMHHYHN